MISKIGTWDWDTFAITVPWPWEGHERHLDVSGYSCFRRDRVGGKRGGGVAFLIKGSITTVVRNYISEGSSSEDFWVELRNKKGMVTFLWLYYRPPNSQRE